MLRKRTCPGKGEGKRKMGKKKDWSTAREDRGSARKRKNACDSRGRRQVSVPRKTEPR